MKILLFGKDGQVGRQLQLALQAAGPLICLGRKDTDFENEDDIRLTIRKHQPAVIVNAAAYTSVDQAESDFPKARMINGIAVGILAEEAERLGALLVHYSTDYVFDGLKSSPYMETDDTNPLNRYGESKLLGEELVQKAGCNFLIFRSSWIYSHDGSNFPLTILRLATEGKRIEVVTDSLGAPTNARLVAEVSSAAINRITTIRNAREASGIYHLVAAGETSWYDYAGFLLNEARKCGLPMKLGADEIIPTRRDQYNPRVRRPQNSRLDSNKLCGQFEISLPDWQSQVAEFVEEIAAGRR